MVSQSALVAVRAVHIGIGAQAPLGGTAEVIGAHISVIAEIVDRGVGHHVVCLVAVVDGAIDTVVALRRNSVNAFAAVRVASLQAVAELIVGTHLRRTRTLPLSADVVFTAQGAVVAVTDVEGVNAPVLLGEIGGGVARIVGAVIPIIAWVDFPGRAYCVHDTQVHESARIAVVAQFPQIVFVVAAGIRIAQVHRADVAIGTVGLRSAGAGTELVTFLCIRARIGILARKAELAVVRGKRAFAGSRLADRLLAELGRLLANHQGRRVYNTLVGRCLSVADQGAVAQVAVFQSRTILVDDAIAEKVRPRAHSLRALVRIGTRILIVAAPLDIDEYAGVVLAADILGALIAVVTDPIIVTANALILATGGTTLFEAAENRAVLQTLAFRTVVAASTLPARTATPVIPAVLPATLGGTRIGCSFRVQRKVRRMGLATTEIGDLCISSLEFGSASIERYPRRGLLQTARAQKQNQSNHVAIHTFHPHPSPATIIQRNGTKPKRFSSDLVVDELNEGFPIPGAQDQFLSGVPGTINGLRRFGRGRISTLHAACRNYR